MKKTLMTICAAVIAAICAVSGLHTATMAAQAPQAAQSPAIAVIVDGQTVTFDQPPQMLNDRVMVQAAPVAEALGWAMEANNAGLYFRKHGDIQTAPGIYATRYLSAIEGNEVWHSDTLMGIHTHHFANEHYPVDSEAAKAAIAAGDACKNEKPTATVAKPVMVNGYTLVALSDVAAALYATTAWDGATKTVAVTSGKLPYYDGEGLPADYKAALLGKATASVTATVTPAPATTTATPAPATTTATAVPKATPAPKDLGFTPTGIMTAAPKVGSVPANILLPGKTDVKSRDSYTIPYRSNLALGYGCNGYAEGRFYETYGYVLRVPMTNPDTFLDDVDKYNKEGWVTDVKTERDRNKIVSGCVAVFQGKTARDTGHFVFVEFVECDKNGNPANVYYTDANYDHTGYYSIAKDAKVIKVTLEKFTTSLYREKQFVGYVMPTK